MRAVVAIVESQLEEFRAEVRRAFSHWRDAERTAAVRRLDLGRALIKIRPAWPQRGPKAKGWGEFLEAEGIDQDVALDAMKYAGYVETTFPGELPENLPTRVQAGLDPPPPSNPTSSGQHVRGGWCTPKPIALAVGRWDLDPFSNPRSHIDAAVSCMLERGDDGFGHEGEPGAYYTAAAGLARAGAETRVWGQPDYSLVLEAVQHYGHTRFCFLLRLDPSTEWFEELFARTELILVPRGDRIEFDPPPGVPASSNPFPHGLFYARAEDATEAIRGTCFHWFTRTAA